MEFMIDAIQQHGPWAAFAGILFFAYYRLVNDVIAAIRSNTEANTQNAEAVKQVTQIMIEVKDTMQTCRKE